VGRGSHGLPDVAVLLVSVVLWPPPSKAGPSIFCGSALSKLMVGVLMQFLLAWLCSQASADAAWG